MACGSSKAVKRKIEGTEDGKRRGLAREEDQIGWLARKASAGGFSVPRVLVVKEGFQAGGKPGHGMTHLAVRIEGLLEVTDPGRFLQTLAAGIGPAKAFGLGLLSLARVS